MISLRCLIHCVGVSHTEEVGRGTWADGHLEPIYGHAEATSKRKGWSHCAIPTTKQPLPCTDSLGPPPCCTEGQQLPQVSAKRAADSNIGSSFTSSLESPGKHPRDGHSGIFQTASPSHHSQKTSAESVDPKRRCGLDCHLL